MIEYDESGAVVWTARWGIVGQGSYRGFKANFTGTPSDDPALAVVDNGNGTHTAYMSWNGATEYTQWELQGCGDSDVEVVEKTGFETSYTGTCNSTVLVKAMNTEGTILGTSNSVLAVSS